jgi:hypothetical protein
LVVDACTTVNTNANASGNVGVSYANANYVGATYTTGASFFILLIFYLFLCCLCFCLMQTQKKVNNGATNQQASTKFAYGMVGVMNEEDLEVGLIGQQAQVGVEDVVALVPSEIVKELVQANENIGETSMTNVNRI